jgi:hypothetical protein
MKPAALTKKELTREEPTPQNLFNRLQQSVSYSSRTLFAFAFFTRTASKSSGPKIIFAKY